MPLVKNQAAAKILAKTDTGGEQKKKIVTVVNLIQII